MWTAVMNVCVVMVPDAEQQCEGGKKRSWWECALPADEEGNYIVTSSRCVRAHKITADSPARLSEITMLISHKPDSFFETTWRWTEQHFENRSVLWADARQILSRSFFATVAHLIAATNGRLQLSFWWKCQLKFNLEVTRRLLWHWYLFWSPQPASSVRISSLFFLDHAYSRVWIFPLLPSFSVSLK